MPEPSSGTLSTGIDIASYAMAGIDNQLSGTIVGASFGIEFASAAIGTVTNSGLIGGGQTGVYLDNKVGAGGEDGEAPCRPGAEFRG